MSKGFIQYGQECIEKGLELINEALQVSQSCKYNNNNGKINPLMKALLEMKVKILRQKQQIARDLSSMFYHHFIHHTHSSTR